MSKKLTVIAISALFATAAAAGDIFTTLDVDKSGSISMSEAKVVPSLTKQWKALDTDANNELSTEEFAKSKLAVTSAPKKG